MKRVVIAAIMTACLSQAAVADGYTECSRFFFSRSQDRLWPAAPIRVFRGTTYDEGPSSDTWNRLDLKPHGVPADAKAVLITGMLIITHGTTPQVANITITFKPPTEPGDPLKYIGQATEGNIGGGQRTNLTAWVAVDNGEIDYAYSFVAPTGHPNYAAYGINMHVDGYCK